MDVTIKNRLNHDNSVLSSENIFGAVMTIGR